MKFQLFSTSLPPHPDFAWRNAIPGRNAIAARAGVSIGSLYQYFRNKDEVYVALRHQHFERIAPLVESLDRALALPRSDIADEIGKFVEALVRVHGPEPDVIRAIDAELGWLESRDASSSREHPERVAQVAELLAKRCSKLSSPPRICWSQPSGSSRAGWPIRRRRTSIGACSSMA